MTDTNLYYTPPSDQAFEELKAKAIEIWQEYDDTYGYATDKVKQIKDILNVSDNFMFMVAMFDVHNQGKLAARLSQDTRSAVCERLRAGGAPINVF